MRYVTTSLATVPLLLNVGNIESQIRHAVAERHFQIFPNGIAPAVPETFELIPSLQGGTTFPGSPKQMHGDEPRTVKILDRLRRS